MIWSILFTFGVATSNVAQCKRGRRHVNNDSSIDQCPAVHVGTIPCVNTSSHSVSVQSVPNVSVSVQSVPTVSANVSVSAPSVGEVWHANVSPSEKDRISEAFALDRSWTRKEHIKACQLAEINTITPIDQTTVLDYEDAVAMWYDRNGFTGAAMNMVLRSNKVSEMRKFGHMAVDLYEAVEQLPLPKALLYSAVPNKVGYEKWESLLGALVSDRGFWSATTVPSSMEHSDIGKRGGGPKVFAVIESLHHHGGYIASFGYIHRIKAEVLLLPGATFRVMAVKKHKNKIYVYLSDRMEFNAGEDVFDVTSGEIVGKALSGRNTTVVDTLREIMPQFPCRQIIFR